MKVRVFLFVLIGIGMIGAVLFFPMKLDGIYTCLYHKIAYSENIVHQQPSQVEMIGSFYNYNRMMEYHHADQMLHRYLVPYGLQWWMSLIVLVFGIYYIKKVQRLPR